MRRGLLPRPLEVGTMPRWRWRDLDSFILSCNGLAPGTPGEAPSEPGQVQQGCPSCRDPACLSLLFQLTCTWFARAAVSIFISNLFEGRSVSIPARPFRAVP